jgi:metal-responsive CopG/Arc/MetJ family transcriptional regulator
MDENIARPRVKLDYNLYEKVKSCAKAKHMNKDEYIATALEHFIEYENNNIQEDDIYTQRINELTQALDAMRHEVASNHQGFNNRLDVLIEYQAPPNYLG